MLISLITPCRNSARLLQGTIESILSQSALQDGSVQLQYLIMDGSSSDETKEVVRPYLKQGIDFLSEPDSGMYDALAKGLSKVSGSIIGYLNAGDVLFPHAFEILAEVFRYPEVNWITGYSTIINDRFQITNAAQPTRYRREFIENGYYVTPSYPYGIQQESTFWSKQLNDHIHLERLRSFKLAGDYFLWTELAKHAELHSVRSLLGAFRVHSGQLSEDKEGYFNECQHLFRQATLKEKLTAYWETRCNPLWRGYLWNHTLGISPAKIFEYNHQRGSWLPR